MTRVLYFLSVTGKAHESISGLLSSYRGRLWAFSFRCGSEPDPRFGLNTTCVYLEVHYILASAAHM